jgi:hypothetical protein
MPLPMLIAGLGLSAVGSVMGGITGAANAKAQGIAANMSNQWANFQQQWQNGQANFELSQRQRFDNERRESVRSTSLANMLSEQREILRQSNIQQSVFSNQYLQAIGSAQAALETRGLPSTEGTGKLIRNQMDQMVMRDVAAIRRNKSIEMNNTVARRNASLGQLGPKVVQLPSTFVPSSAYSVPSTTGMLIGSMLSAIGGLSSGIATGIKEYG